jgi:hypothetical protein
VAAGQGAVPHQREEPVSYPAGRDRQPTRLFQGPRRSPDSRLQSGYALLPSRIRRHSLILIDVRPLILIVARQAEHDMPAITSVVRVGDVVDIYLC